MKILIRLPNWLGDIVMSTAFINAVNELYTNAVVDIIVKNEFKGIATLIPGIRKVFPFSKKEFPGLIGAWRFGVGFRHEKYDLCFNLPVSISSITMAYAAHAIKQIGFKEAATDFFFTNAYKRPSNAHRVEEYVSLVENFSGKPIAVKEVRLVPESITSLQYNALINFNSEAESRRMPVDKGISIIKSLIAAFPRLKFLFIGSPGQRQFIDTLINSFHNDSRLENLAGETDLETLASLMARSSVLLTTDSGPAHLANSVGTPVVALFGAGNENNTTPYNKQNLHVLRAGKLSCEPCVNNVCKLYGKPKCMQLLDETAIINALSLYLPYA